MASSVERDEEVVSLELPAPSGWTKKVLSLSLPPFLFSFHFVSVPLVRMNLKLCPLSFGNSAELLAQSIYLSTLQS